MSAGSKKDNTEMPGKQAIPDSTTKERDVKPNDRAKFKEGEDVLVMHKDGRFYLGTAVEICSETEKCLVKFGDGTERWSLFKDITRLSIPEVDAVTCVVCKSSQTKHENDIVVCKKCARGYHQKCHQPMIKSDEETDWKCCRCECNKNCQLSPVTQKTVSSTSKDCSLPQSLDELPYDVNELVWDIDHTMNTSQQYCYCGKTGDWFVKMIQCGRCLQWFHEKCVHCLLYPLHLGDRFYVFICSICNVGVEFVRRLEMKWVDMVHLVIFNLIAYHAKRYYDFDSEIVEYVNLHWNTLQLPPKIFNTTLEERKRSILAVLTKNRHRFKCSYQFKKRASWGLKKRGPPSPPKYTLPSASPLTDKILSNEWKGDKRLKYISLDNSCYSLNVRKTNIPNGLKPSEDGLKLLRIANTPLLLPKGMPATGHKVCIKSATPTHTDRSDIERRILRQQAKEQRRVKSSNNRKTENSAPSPKTVAANNSSSSSSSISDNQVINNSQLTELPLTPPSSVSAPETPQTLSCITNSDPPTPPAEDTSSMETFDLFIANSSNNVINNSSSILPSNNNLTTINSVSHTNITNNNNNNNSNSNSNNNNNNNNNANTCTSSNIEKNMVNIDNLFRSIKGEIIKPHITLPLSLKHVITDRIVRPTKRRLSEKDIIVKENGEVKRRRVRRQHSSFTLNLASKGSNGYYIAAQSSSSSAAAAKRYCTNDSSVVTANASGGMPMTPVKSSYATSSYASTCDDLKSSVYSYFGTETRIAAGEEYTVLGKRTTLDGSVQYLIEWKNSNL